MPDAICNTSSLLYLYRIEAIDWLPQLFDEIWAPSAVIRELQEGQHRGYDIPRPNKYEWLKIIDPHAVPSEWLTLDLGQGELATMAAGIGKPRTSRVVR